MSVTEIAHLKATDAEELVGRLAELRQVMTEVEGCEKVSFFRCIDKTDEFAAILEWSDVDAHERFLASPDFNRLVGGPIATHLVGNPNFSYFEAI